MRSSTGGRTSRVNVGLIEGGTRPNVVAEHALMKVDIRALSRSRLEEAEAAARAIAAGSTVPDVTCEVVERARHWPMEKLERSARLVEHAREIAIAASAFASLTRRPGAPRTPTRPPGMGVPTLDGLGPIGGNDHSPAEYLDVRSVGAPGSRCLRRSSLATARDPVVAAPRN